MCIYLHYGSVLAQLTEHDCICINVTNTLRSEYSGICRYANMLNELFTCHCTCFVVFRYCSDKQLIITFLFREVFPRTGPLTSGNRS